MIRVTHIVNSVFSSRTYALSIDGETDYWLVDCGDLSPLLKAISVISNNIFSIKGVLLTHTHYDHIYGLPHLIELFPSVIIYTNQNGCDELADPKKNLSKYHEDPIIIDSKYLAICNEEDKFELFQGVTAIAHFTPGHSHSCITYEIESYLFTGDSYIPGLKVVTNLPGSNKDLAVLSQQRILEIAKEKIVCPGHEI